MGKLIGITVAVVLLVIFLASSMYVVQEAQYAIVLQFGKVVTTRSEPGLYFKTPIAQSVITLEKRLMEWDGEPSNLYTSERERIEINTWARWRISEPRRFYEALKTEMVGQGAVDDNVESSVKDVISAQPLMQALRNTSRRLKYTAEELEEAEAARNIQVIVGRDKVVEDILVASRMDMEDKYGIEIEGVAIKSFNYVQQVIPKIYDRMRSERLRIANLYESEGQESSSVILGDMAKELESIESEGTKQATIVRGAADAEVLRIYAEAYGKDPEFYSFVRSLQALETSIGERTRLVIGTDGPLFRYLKEIESDK